MRNFVHKCLEATIGNLFGKDVTCREPIHRCDPYQPGVLEEFGRIAVKLFKKFLMPCGLCAAVPLMKSEEEKPVSVSDVSDKNNKQSSDLGPYYRATTRRAGIEDSEPSRFEQKIAVIRRSIQDKIKTVTVYKNTITDAIDTGYAHSKNTLDYLREEENVLPRIGAVGIGGLSGLILGLRGGKFKKLVYSSTSALIVGSICYPKQAEEGLKLVKYYFNIGYNFLRGVKPEENNEPEVFPVVQNVNYSKVSDMVSNSTVGILFNKIIKAYNDFASTPEPPGEKKSKES